MKSVGQTQRLVWTALCVTLGVLLPFVTGHAFGLSGTVFLPMHLPVLLCGLLCGAKYGALCGLATPVLSSVLTGMPTAFPMLPLLSVQLLVLGACAGWLYVRCPLYPSVCLAIALGWLVYGGMFSLLLLGSTRIQAPGLWLALCRGLPGILLQVLVVPPVLLAFQKPASLRWKHKVKVQGLAGAQKAVRLGTASCMVLQDGSLVYHSTAAGLLPLLQVYATQASLLQGACVVDKIIGKAAAMILVLGGVERVHACTMSQSAKAYLSAYGISLSYDTLTNNIRNRQNNGLCPMESLVLDVDDPQEGFARLQATLCTIP